MRFSVLPLLLLPFLELWLMIAIGDEVGALAVVLWIIAMIVLGVYLLRYLGASSMLKVAQSMRAGELPAATIADGVFKAMGAVLLIVPGFITDTLALLCFIPIFRRLLLKRWSGKMTIHTDGFSRHSAFGHETFRDPRAAQGNVYEHEGAAKSDQTGLLIDQEKVDSTGKSSVGDSKNS